MRYCVLTCLSIENLMLFTSLSVRFAVNTTYFVRKRVFVSQSNTFREPYERVFKRIISDVHGLFWENTNPSSTVVVRVVQTVKPRRHNTVGAQSAMRISPWGTTETPLVQISLSRTAIYHYYRCEFASKTRDGRRDPCERRESARRTDQTGTIIMHHNNNNNNSHDATTMNRAYTTRYTSPAWWKSKTKKQKNRFLLFEMFYFSYTKK